MATRSPKRWKNWPATAGVSAISGTSSNALRPKRNGGVDRLQVYLGFSRTGDAFEQKCSETFRLRSAAFNLLVCFQLMRIQSSWRRHRC